MKKKVTKRKKVVKRKTTKPAKVEKPSTETLLFFEEMVFPNKIVGYFNES